MPLAPGSDQATISQNISELTHHGSRKRNHDQIVAIALSNADRTGHALGGGIGSFHPAKVMSSSEGTPWWTKAAAHEMMAPAHGIGGHFAAGGMMSPSEASPWTERADARIIDMPMHGGLIGGSGAGRTDRLPLSVPSGSHVIPSDAVSGAGQGSTQFGANALQAAMRTGPYGVALPKEVHGRGPPAAQHASMAGENPTGIEKSMMTGLAQGGEAHHRTSILAASGEMVVSAEDVVAIGERGIRDGLGKRNESAENVGHRLIDEMIARIRKFNIEWLKHAPPPKR